MKPPVVIVDVCGGNVRSVQRAFERVGADVRVTRDPETVRRADRLVVPGQGAFGVFMRGLTERGLGEALREALASGRPYLGICLGLQVLFDESEESEGSEGSQPGDGGRPCPGLGVLRGRVAKLVPAGALKVPHMGWNRVRSPSGARDRLLAGVDDDAYVYFVHSFHAVPAEPGLVALEADHGVPITAAVRKDHLFACQFHPEKSQTVGLQILRNFVDSGE